MAETDTNPQGEKPVAWLLWLERLPKAAVFLAVLVITFGVLVTPAPGGAILVLVLAAASLFLVLKTWKRHGAGARVLRLVPVLALAALGVVKFFV